MISLKMRPFFFKCTIRHAAQSLKESDENGQGQAAVACDVEDEKHEQEDKGRLANEDGKLVDQMSQHNFSHLDTCENICICEIALTKFENRIIPATMLRSRSPDFRSLMNTAAVRATAIK